MLWMNFMLLRISFTPFSLLRLWGKKTSPRYKCCRERFKWYKRDNYMKLQGIILALSWKVWCVIQTQKVPKYDHYDSIATLKGELITLLKLRNNWIWDEVVSVSVYMCMCVSMFEPYRQRPLLQDQAVLTNICTSHTDLVSWVITADMTHGAPLCFEKNIYII